MKNKKYLFFATSLATTIFVYYKLLKKKHPSKIKNLKNKSLDINQEIYNFNDDYNEEKLYKKSDEDIDEKSCTKYINMNQIEDKIYKIKNLEDNQDINFPDDYLEDEIRYQLCLSNNEKIELTTLKRLERIDFFELDNRELDIYCSFLAKYTNIKSIVIDALNPLKYGGDISETNISLTDISPLTKLCSLEELSFNWGISYIDFSILNKIKTLKKLEIKFGMVEDISFLQDMQNLEYLEIMLSSQIKDISNILNLNKLETLYLYSNININIEDVKNMTSLKYLYLNGESISLN